MSGLGVSVVSGGSTSVGTEAFLLAHEVSAVLAQAEPIPPEGPEFGKASPVGIPVVLIMLVAIFLLVRNMNARLKNLPDSFDEENPEPDQLADEGTDRAGVEPGEPGQQA